MKIWIDLRFIDKKDLYSNFVLELVQNFILDNKDHKYIVYSNQDNLIEESEKVETKKVSIEIWSLKEQTTLNKIYKKDSNDLMIFFDFYKPLFYKNDYYLFIPSLKEVYYQNFKNHFKKYKFLLSINKAISYSKKIICFDQNTKNELIERFNVEEEKINIIKWFFPNLDKINKESIKIDIKTKNNIKNDYLIYYFWDWIEKNLERLVRVIKSINDEWTNLDLVLIWNEISKNIYLRKLAIESKIEKNIHFIWEIKESEKRSYFENSIWAIFPSLYETFSFCLWEVISFNTPIIASNIKNIKDIFSDKAYYFSAISKSNILENLKKFIASKKKVNYENIKKIYSKEETIKSLSNIIR